MHERIYKSSSRDTAPIPRMLLKHLGVLVEVMERMVDCSFLLTGHDPKKNFITEGNIASREKKKICSDGKGNEAQSSGSHKRGR